MIKTGQKTQKIRTFSKIWEKSAVLSTHSLLSEPHISPSQQKEEILSLKKLIIIIIYDSLVWDWFYDKFI